MFLDQYADVTSSWYCSSELSSEELGSCFNYSVTFPCRSRGGSRGNVRGFQRVQGVPRGFQRVPGVPRGFLQRAPGVPRGFQGFLCVSLPNISGIFPFSSGALPEGSRNPLGQRVPNPEGSRHPLCSLAGSMGPLEPSQLRRPWSRFLIFYLINLSFSSRKNLLGTCSSSVT